jgi:S1-C subfamily serine protease
MNRRLVAIAAAALTAMGALTSCVDPPPTKPPEVAPAPAPVSGEDALSALFRQTRAYTVRIRVVKCDNAGTGTGFAIDKRTIVTNRHVVDGSLGIEVETWDGRSLAVASTEEAVGPDLAIVHLAQDAPAVAPKLSTRDPKVQTPLHVIGYPEGHTPRENNGVVVRYVGKSPLDPSGTVMQMSGDVEPGNSGSPIVDNAGTVVGVAYAYELATGWVTAVPVSRLRPLLRGQGLMPVTGC